MNEKKSKKQNKSKLNSKMMMRTKTIYTDAHD